MIWDVCLGGGSLIGGILLVSINRTRVCLGAVNMYLLTASTFADTAAAVSFHTPKGAFV
jgi:hypothetical protein